MERCGLYCDICGNRYTPDDHKKYSHPNTRIYEKGFKSMYIGYAVHVNEWGGASWMLDKDICPECIKAILETIRERHIKPGEGKYDEFVTDKKLNGVGIIHKEGCHDGYYFDQRVVFTYKNRLFIHIDFGSYSGYHPNYGGIAFLSDEKLHEGLLKNWEGNTVDENDPVCFDEKDLAKYADALVASGLDYLDLWRDEGVDDETVLRP